MFLDSLILSTNRRGICSLLGADWIFFPAGGEIRTVCSLLFHPCFSKAMIFKETCSTEEEIEILDSEKEPVRVTPLYVISLLQMETNYLPGTDCSLQVELDTLYWWSLRDHRGEAIES